MPCSQKCSRGDAAKAPRGGWLSSLRRADMMKEAEILPGRAGHGRRKHFVIRTNVHMARFDRNPRDWSGHWMPGAPQLVGLGTLLVGWATFLGGTSRADEEQPQPPAQTEQ